MDNIKRVTLAKEIEDPYYLKDPKLLELYNKCLPPREAYYFFPKGDEIVIHNLKKPNKTFRRIYYNVPYTEQEKKWIEEFKQIINSHPETQLPDFFDDYLLLAFIYATSVDMEESYKKIVAYIKFSRETFPIVIKPNSKFIEILNKGFVYVYGRDNRARPIVVCQCKVFQKYYKNYQTDEILQAVFFLCQFLVNNMLIPGQIESWVFILNLSGVSIISLPEPVKKLIPGLSDYFLARLYKNYIIGLNFISRIIYKLACNFLDDVTVSKINVLDDENDPKLFETIRRDNVEKQFGGTAPDMPVDSENGFFPPRMPSGRYIKDDENPKDFLITEEEYIKKYKNGEIPEGCVSPYVYEQLKQEQINKDNDINNIAENNEEIKEMSPQSIVDNFERKQSPTPIENPMPSISMKDKIIIENERIQRENILARKKTREMVQNFATNNWNYDDELSFPINHRFSSSSLKEGNIVDDIYRFGRKKQSFFKHITSFNTQTISYISDY